MGRHLVVIVVEIERRSTALSFSVPFIDRLRKAALLVSVPGAD
jgi:hypothetical protein